MEYTVFGVYADNLQRFAYPLKAASADAAEQMVREVAKEPVYIAATVEGDVTPVDGKTHGDE